MAVLDSAATGSASLIMPQAGAMKDVASRGDGGLDKTAAVGRATKARSSIDKISRGG
jgi:hypothetical protein